MKKGFMRFVAVFLALLTVTMYVPMNEGSMFAVQASAKVVNGSLGGVTWKYDTSSNVLTISGNGNMSDSSSTPKDFTKLIIGTVDYINKDAEKIVVNNGVLSIGNFAFNGFEKVTSVSLPASLKRIGKDAFSGMKKLQSVTLPASLTTIDTNAFNNTGITKVEIPYSVKSYGTNAFPSSCKVVCNYGDAAYNKVNKANVELRQPVINASIEKLSGTQIKLNVYLQNASGVNAANFTIAYNDGIVPVSTSPVVNELNGTSVATVYDTANRKVNLAVVNAAEIAYSDCTGNCQFAIASVLFDFAKDSHVATADISSTAMLYANKRISIANAQAKYDEHNFVLNGAVVQPTCTQKGYTPEICSICKETREVNYVDALGHDYKSVVTPATCVDKGFTTHTCSRCDDVKVDTYTDLAPHDYDVKVTPATCQSKGYTTYTCKVCSHTYTGDETDFAFHDYDVKVTPATCQSKGYTTYTCKVCSHTYTGDETDFASHDYVATVTEATCTQSGYTTFKCKHCDDGYKGAFTAALGHEYGEDGKCVRCGEAAPVNSKLEFNDSTVFAINEEAKVVVINKTLKTSELQAAIVNEGWVVTAADGSAADESKAVATKYLIKSTVNDEVYTVIIMGDVNCDGKVTSADARLALRASAKLDTFDEYVTVAANCDGKGSVTAADARIILRVAAKLQTF